MRQPKSWFASRKFSGMVGKTVRMQFMPITRRSFLAASAALRPFRRSPLARLRPGRCRHHRRGRGWHCRGAALAAAGKRFALLEASDRVGGRCVTDDRMFGVPFDRGAHWLAHGRHQSAHAACCCGENRYLSGAGGSFAAGRPPRRARRRDGGISLGLVRSRRAISEAGAARPTWPPARPCRRISATWDRHRIRAGTFSIRQGLGRNFGHGLRPGGRARQRRLLPQGLGALAGAARARHAGAALGARSRDQLAAARRSVETAGRQP